MRCKNEVNGCDEYTAPSHYDCCSGRDCACGGVVVEPEFCSQSCEDEFNEEEE
jgi:hypothetical protein